MPGAHRDLHSFPTRRSSDLGTLLALQTAAASFAGPGTWLLLGIAPARTAGRGKRSRISQVRSEEHTSELQSQSNLVCRLLLEKKKKKKKQVRQASVCYTRHR